MKKSLCLLLSIVSSCPFFVHAEQLSASIPPKKITCEELFGQLEVARPKTRTYLLKPEVVAAVAAGVVTTTCGKPVVKPVVHAVVPPTRSASFLIEALLFGLGVGVTGLGVYSFMGNEMGVIVAFKSTLKKLTAHMAQWQTIIDHLQKNQTDQEVKLAQAQLQIQKMLPLMEQLVKQSSNEQVLAKTVGHLYVECAGMIDRIKTLETTLQALAELEGQTTEAAQAQRAAELKKLVIKSNNIFGKPQQKPTSHWWSTGKKYAPAF